MSKIRVQQKVSDSIFKTQSHERSGHVKKVLGDKQQEVQQNLQCPQNT